MKKKWRDIRIKMKIKDYILWDERAPELIFPIQFVDKWADVVYKYDDFDYLTGLHRYKFKKVMYN